MIQCQVTINVTPECFSDWEPKEMVAFFSLLAQLVKLKELADNKPKVQHLTDEIKHYEKHLAELREWREIIKEDMAERGIPRIPTPENPPVLEAVVPTTEVAAEISDRCGPPPTKGKKLYNFS